MHAQLMHTSDHDVYVFACCAFCMTILYGGQDTCLKCTGHMLWTVLTLAITHGMKPGGCGHYIYEMPCFLSSCWLPNALTAARRQAHVLEKCLDLCTAILGSYDVTCTKFNIYGGKPDVRKHWGAL